MLTDTNDKQWVVKPLINFAVQRYSSTEAEKMIVTSSSLADSFANGMIIGCINLTLGYKIVYCFWLNTMNCKMNVYESLNPHVASL
jgi:hypothetical protein